MIEAIVPNLHVAGKATEKEISHRESNGRCHRCRKEERVPVDVKMHKLAISGVLRANATKAMHALSGMGLFAHSGSAIYANVELVVHLRTSRSFKARLHLHRSLMPASFRLREGLAALTRRMTIKLCLVHKMMHHLLLGTERRRIRQAFAGSLSQLPLYYSWLQLHRFCSRPQYYYLSG